jgi:hypothetical protein
VALVMVAASGLGDAPARRLAALIRPTEQAG